MARPQPRNILVCFDAFGTLIWPRKPVPQQYGEAARKLGLGGFSDRDIKTSFKKAFTEMMKDHPNYGHQSSMGAETWWTNLIHRTFTPLLNEKDRQTIHRDLAPLLLRRFSSGEGYRLVDEEIGPLLRELRPLRRHQVVGTTGSEDQQRPYRVALGVITNSDDRIPAVFSSLGLGVGPLRGVQGLLPAGDATGGIAEEPQHDIDFCCMSYDVGREKPDAAIFRAAESLASTSIRASGRVQTGAEGEEDGLQPGGSAPESDWTSIYVGDDYAHDVCGAVEAGWHGILVGTEGGKARSLPGLTTSVSSIEDLVSSGGRGFRAESAATVLRWLCGQLARFQQPA
ncbi:hypothetical protein MAPG_02086 [Magnaporthiopsis poae ATCC 64411]|uniref:Haloacid dehalogenase n=1 Tax=Magnaporthiopsis poae (strain ATCC 64411 / 73-15) TaxID=644358 RepID=A0A0C4DQE6_MAGP6|nr:hypothetical protein MAPG_02086 [Magnaporthiopsis poae ATCC 64411]